MNELTLAPPTTTLRGGATYRDGGITVEVIPNYPAHTFGDLMVYLPEYRSSSRETSPSTTSRRPVTTRHITKWIEAIDRIGRMDVDLIVPGHGPIGTKAELSQTRAYLELMRRRRANGTQWV